MSAIVVGVSYAPGIGYAVAKRFAQAGLKVGIVGRQQPRLEEAKKLIEDAVEGATVAIATGDVTDKASIDSALGSLIEAHGVPDSLIYNVSSRPMPTVSVAEVDPDRLLNDYKTGAYGAVLCVQKVIAGMRERGSGSILLTGATASMRGAPGFGAFSAAKAGLKHLAQALAKEEMSNGIHVAHIIIDGMVDMAVMRQYAADLPDGRLIDTEGIAEVYYNLHMQSPRCFTFEQDLRPYMSQW
mmetsp:Transcript_14930/g.56679  ORF Transcript_14930/g.56679 Transcript_14930/m.56679 type:complete len:241 (-) Transcript_14930:4028-4750(-)